MPVSQSMAEVSDSERMRHEADYSAPFYGPKLRKISLIHLVIREEYCTCLAVNLAVHHALQRRTHRDSSPSGMQSGR